ncbi:MAG: ribbon-helix-helix domain-containing protein [Candidatus Bathyarchaeia archaeon]
MGKITVEISDSVEKALRRYIADRFWENPKGKLSAFVEEAIKEKLEKVGMKVE